MATTKLWTIDELIKQLEGFKKAGYTQVITSRNMHGVLYAPSTKCNLYRVPVAVAGDAFKTKSIGHLGASEFGGAKNANMGMFIILVHKTKEKDLTTPKEGSYMPGF